MQIPTTDAVSFGYTVGQSEVTESDQKQKKCQVGLYVWKHNVAKKLGVNIAVFHLSFISRSLCLSYTYKDFDPFEK